nr:EKC/KEOPS complex subunit LAGE3-like [Dasypus novemcinctus]
MEAGEEDAAGGASGPPGPGSPGSTNQQAGPGSPGGPGGPGGAINAGVVGAAGGDAGPDAPRAPASEGSPRQLRTFLFRVPFPSYIEAEIARRSLISLQQPHQQAIRTELSVTGSFLVVKWFAEDRGQLRLFFNSFMQQLFLVVQAMNHFVFLFATKRRRGWGA